jgi:cell division protein FtsA
MFDNSNVIVGLEIGTSKICCIVGELHPDTGALNIVAVGRAKSRGVRKGEIVDAAVAEEDVRAAIIEAEDMSNSEINSVYLGVSGAHIRGTTNRGVHPIVSHDRAITEEDVDDVVKNSKVVNLPPGDHVIHAVRQHFIVDGQRGIKNPDGMHGARLELDMHVVHGNVNRLQTAVRLVKNLKLEVDDVVFNGLAAPLALLAGEQKEMGALVIDLGGGTTNYAVYAGGVLKYTGVLALGGDHVTNDLAVGLKMSPSRAETLKLEHGGAFADEAVYGKTIPIPSDVGLPAKLVNWEHLRRIQNLRLEEIFQLVGRDLDEQGMLEKLRGGIVLCGGGARTPGIVKLAVDVFQMPVSLGQTTTVSSIKTSVDQPEFVAAIGLVKFGSQQQRRRRGRSFVTNFRDTLGTLFKIGA